MKFLFIFFLNFLGISSCFAVTCIKPSQKTVNTQVIYLHGMDTFSPSTQELEIRKTLEKLSNELGVSFAIPRAFEKCPENKNQRCWMWGAEKKEVVREKRNKIIEEAKSCFNNSPNFIWLGFSNGGNFVSQIFQECVNRGDYITFGASGGHIIDGPSSLKNCGKFKALIGKKDKWNYAHAIKFYSGLKNKKGHVEVTEFSGGHELNANLLKEIVKEYVK